ncbi:hypothetical protein ACI77O_13430 [Pseudomonas tritici]|uniref:hypothetical protein n=1 Tax=Pseudomonas tritici TaxID=2745518 RepID=UPI00387B72A5
MNTEDRKYFHRLIAESKESGQAHADGRELIVGMRFSYRNYPYTIQSFMCEVEPDARKKTSQGGIEYWNIDLRYCTASEATFVHGDGLGPVYAPIDKIRTFGMGGWSDTDVETAQKAALSLGQEGSFAITIRRRLWGDE